MIGLLIGSLGWLIQFLGLRIPFIVSAFISGIILFSLFIDHFRYKVIPLQKLINFLLFVNITGSSWIGYYWENQHYPISSILVIRFFMITFLFLSGFIVLTYLHSDKPIKAKTRHAYSFKTSFKNKRKARDDDDDEIKIILGEMISREN
jgi:hypothetical protein